MTVHELRKRDLPPRPPSECDLCEKLVYETDDRVTITVEITLNPYEASISPGHSISTGFICRACYENSESALLYDASFPVQPPLFRSAS